MRQTSSRPAYLLILAALCSCTSNEIGNGKDINPETVYIEYSVTYVQDIDTVTCLAQYRFGGKNGTTLVLDTPGKVALDGHVLKVDSNDYTGAYYQHDAQGNKFTGEHEWQFTGMNGKLYREKFNFRPGHLITKLPAAISNRNDLVFTLEGEDTEQLVNIEMRDTAAATPNLNLKERIVNNTITVTAAELKTFSKGLLSIKFYREEEQPLKNATAEGGSISFHYMIGQYEVQLTD